LAEISESREICGIELHKSVNRFEVILTKQIIIGHSMKSIRDDVPAENLAELI